MGYPPEICATPQYTCDGESDPGKGEAASAPCLGKLFYEGQTGKRSVLFFNLRLGEQGKGDLPDALAVDGFDGEGIAAEADLLSTFGEGAGEFQQESGQGVGFAFGGFEGLLLVVVEVHGAVEVLE